MSEKNVKFLITCYSIFYLIKILISAMIEFHINAPPCRWQYSAISFTIEVNDWVCTYP